MRHVQWWRRFLIFTAPKFFLQDALGSRRAGSVVSRVTNRLMKWSWSVRDGLWELSERVRQASRALRGEAS